MKFCVCIEDIPLTHRTRFLDKLRSSLGMSLLHRPPTPLRERSPYIHVIHTPALSMTGTGRRRYSGEHSLFGDCTELPLDKVKEIIGYA